MNKLLKTLAIVALPFVILPFIMSACKKDPCEGVFCINGGACVNGACACPTGFTGPACETQLTPKSITIKAITITKFPQLDPTGSRWDGTSDADLYISLETPQGTVIWRQDGNYSNVTQSMLPLRHLPLIFPVITNPENQIVIKLYDNDSPLSPDYVGGIITPLFTLKNSFAPKIIVGGVNNITNFELDVEYKF
jgi:hypothetical protein